MVRACCQPGQAIHGVPGQTSICVGQCWYLFGSGSQQAGGGEGGGEMKKIPGLVNPSLFLHLCEQIGKRKMGNAVYMGGKPPHFSLKFDATVKC